MERNMVSVVLVVVSLIVAGSAAADEFYVPLGSGVEGGFITEVRIVNRSENSVTVAVEPLAAFGPVGKPTPITLDPGQTTQWSDIDAEHAASERFGALAITADGPLVVTAIRRCACGAISTVPVLDLHDAIDEGAMRLGTQSPDPAWKSGFGVVNRDAVGALLTVSLHRGERVIEEGAVFIPGRGARVISLNDVFRASASEANDWLSFSAPESVLVFGYDANERTGAQFFTPAAPAATTPARRRAARHGSPQPSLQTVVLTPSKDDTLYETSNGSLSNGGAFIFSPA